MKTRYLFPHIYRKIGLFIFTPAAILGLLLITEAINFPVLETNVISITSPDLFLSGDVSISASGYAVSNDPKGAGIIKNDIVDELISVLIIIGAILTACSREKYEDEYIAKIRLESLLWATYLNYALLLVAIIFVYGLDFFTVTIYNMFTLLLFFLVRFNYILFRNSKYFGNEK